MIPSPNFKCLDASVDGEIGSLILNRPGKLNALSLQLLREITEAAAWLNSQTGVRCVIVSGRGPAFCAGADLQGFPSLDDPEVRAAADAGRVMAEAVDGINAITIARIHGWCVGGGVVLAAACDLRLAADSARFSIPEVDLGIPLAWGGIPRLVREIGPARTKELVLTCREFSAQEADNIGFLNRVIAEEKLSEDTMVLAEQLAAKPAMPVVSTKRHVNAVTAEMGKLDNAWSDADGLLLGLLDEECQKARAAYVKHKLGGGAE